jgi:hypothetical protein
VARPQGGRPAAILYPFKHTTPFAYGLRLHSNFNQYSMQATLLDTPPVKIVALQAIFDSLLVYGIGAFNDTQLNEQDNR